MKSTLPSRSACLAMYLVDGRALSCVGFEIGLNRLYNLFVSGFGLRVPMVS